jgi:hypothetical protein
MTLHHPQADALRAALGALTRDPRLTVEPGPAGLQARFCTPDGDRLL